MGCLHFLLIRALNCFQYFPVLQECLKVKTTTKTPTLCLMIIKIRHRGFFSVKYNKRKDNMVRVISPVRQHPIILMSLKEEVR